MLLWRAFSDLCGTDREKLVETKVVEDKIAHRLNAPAVRKVAPLSRYEPSTASDSSSRVKKGPKTAFLMEMGKIHTNTKL